MFRIQNIREREKAGREGEKEYSFVMFRFSPHGLQLSHMRSKKYKEAE